MKHIQVIQIETLHGSCPNRFEQPTKFQGPSGCANFKQIERAGVWPESPGLFEQTKGNGI